MGNRVAPAFAQVVYQAIITANAAGGADQLSLAFGSGGLIAFTIDTAGSAGTPGTYTSVAVSGGTGTGALVTVIVGAGGTVTSITITTAGTGYKASDTGFSVASGSIGSTTGFTFHLTPGPLALPSSQGLTYWVRLAVGGFTTALNSGIRYKIGDGSPATGTTYSILPAASEEYIEVNPGQKVAIVSNNANTPLVTITELT